MLNTHNAAIVIDGVWRHVKGHVDHASGEFVYLYNGRSGTATNGTYQYYPIEYSNNDIEGEVIRLNISALEFNKPKKKTNLTVEEVRNRFNRRPGRRG